MPIDKALGRFLIHKHKASKTINDSTVTGTSVADALDTLAALANIPDNWVADKPAIRLETGYDDEDDIGEELTLGVYEYDAASVVVDDNSLVLKPSNIIASFTVTGACTLNLQASPGVNIPFAGANAAALQVAIDAHASFVATVAGNVVLVTNVTAGDYISWNTLAGLITDTTAAGRWIFLFTVVSTTASQTLTNKTLGTSNTFITNATNGVVKLTNGQMSALTVAAGTYVSYWTDANTIGGAYGFTYNGTNLITQTSDAQTIHQLWSANAVLTTPSLLGFYKNHGTIAAPAAVIINEQIGAISFNGYISNAASAETARIEAIASGNYGLVECATDLVFKTSATIAVGIAERLRIASTGTIGYGTSDIEKWWTGVEKSAMHFGVTGVISALTAGGIIQIGDNYYQDADTVYKLRSANVASINYQYNGNHYFYSAAAGVIDSVITWRPDVVISSGGNITATSTVDADTTTSAVYKFVNTNANVAMANTDRIGAIEFWGQYDGTVGHLVQGASIKAVASAAYAGLTNAPTDLVFSTTNTTAALTERMRIDNAGKVGIGNTPTNASFLELGTINTAADAYGTANTFIHTTTEDAIVLTANGNLATGGSIQFRGSKPGTLTTNWSVGRISPYSFGSSFQQGQLAFSIASANNTFLRTLIIASFSSTARIGIGAIWTASVPSYNLTFTNAVAQTCGVETALINTDGSNFTFNAGNCLTGGTTDAKNGGMFSINPGISKSTGFASFRVGRNSRSATAVNTLNTISDAFIIPSEFNLTDAGNNDLFKVALAAGEITGGVIDFTISADDGTDKQSYSGSVHYSVVDKAGALTSTITETIGVTALSSGTLTTAWSIVDGANEVTIRLVPTSSLVPTTMKIRYTIHNGGASLITQL